jgi:GNAT superfamily N-acetyltransferase
MSETKEELVLRPALGSDHKKAESIRQSAFEPVFASFKSILGNDIYNLAQAAEDNAQCGILAELFEPNSEWELHIAELSGSTVGFISLKLDATSHVGEIGLNAVDPGNSGNGIGTKMYGFALQRMKDVGMKVATVGTGGDPSHTAARNAYRKAGFDTEIPSVWMCKLLED